VRDLFGDSDDDDILAPPKQTDPPKPAAEVADPWCEAPGPAPPAAAPAAPPAAPVAEVADPWCESSGPAPSLVADPWCEASGPAPSIAKPPAASGGLFESDGEEDDILAPPKVVAPAASQGPAALLQQRQSLFDDDDAEEAAVAAAQALAKKAKEEMAAKNVATSYAAGLYTAAEASQDGRYHSPSERSEGVMEGYFSKRSGLVFTEWKTRWLHFDLKAAVITYYSAKGDSEPVGAINIRNATVTVDDSQKLDWCFLVVTAPPESKKHYICAQDATEMQDWMDAILHYMTAERRETLNQASSAKKYTPKEQAIADELEKFKDAITSLKEHMADNGGRRDTIPAELLDACLEAQKTIKAWVSRPDICANDHLIFELLHWNDQVNTAVGMAGAGDQA